MTGQVGVSFSYRIAAQNSPMTYGAIGLPLGLTLNPATGLIQGTPQVEGLFPVALAAQNLGGTGTNLLTLTVYPAAPVITSAGSAAGAAGVAFSYLVTAANRPVCFATTTLPSGLSLDPLSGVISGVPSVAGTFNVTLTATNIGGSGSMALQVSLQPDVPQIVNQPQSVLAAAGSPAILSVYAVAAYPLAFQWQKQGVRLPGQTNAVLTWNSVQPSDASGYRVVVSNAFGVVTSAVATLSVGSIPQITAQPTSQTNTPGASIVLSVQASGLAPLSYQWRFNGAVLPGATRQSLQLTNLQAAQVGYYRVEVSNSVGSVSSGNALIALFGQPVILLSPQSLTLAAGSKATFRVQAAGATPLTYQWRKDGGDLTDGARITGVATDTLSLLGVQADDAGVYSIRVTNPFGTAMDSAQLSLGGVAAPVFLTDTAERLRNGEFSVTISGAAGRAVEVWSSANLTNWVWLTSLTNQTGTVLFTDPATNLPQRFYRLRQP
ncbi:MAG: immunoglobulin domain-containing protein [Verrucomicrobia bacterium]|nr:immunoglobulin domain-containing protein [Verrucomicrobiota bacterium]